MPSELFNGVWAGIFGVAMLAFGVASMCLSGKQSRVTADAAIVSAITAAAYLGLAASPLAYIDIAGKALPFLLWLSYVPSLYLIARTILVLREVNGDDADGWNADHYSFVLALVGLGGVLGLKMHEWGAGGWWIAAVIVITAIVYAYWIGAVVRASSNDAPNWLFGIFIVITVIAYVLAYVLDIYVTAAWWIALSPWVGAFGNLLTKIVLLALIAWNAGPASLGILSTDGDLHLA